MDHPLISARNVSKTYSNTKALNQVNLEMGTGKVLGLVGPNGAGKTTFLQSLLGLIPCEGEIQVLELDPFKQRVEMLSQVSYISDVAVIPKWMKVHQAISYMSSVHPQFSAEKARKLLSNTNIPNYAAVKTLSKGMATQLYLDLILSIDAKLLVLDEPTLGLDLLARRKFYSHLLENFYSSERSVIITSHQIEEIEHILNHVVFIQAGQILLDQSLDDLKARFQTLQVDPQFVQDAQSLNPVYQRDLPDKKIMIFENEDEAQLKNWGQLGSTSLADIFVALMGQEGT